MCKLILNHRDPEVQIAMERLAGGPDAYCNTHTWRYIYTLRQAPGKSVHVFAHACHPEDLEPRTQAVPIPTPDTALHGKGQNPPQGTKKTTEQNRTGSRVLRASW